MTLSVKPLINGVITSSSAVICPKFLGDVGFRGNAAAAPPIPTIILPTPFMISPSAATAFDESAVIFGEFKSTPIGTVTASMMSFRLFFSIENIAVTPLIFLWNSC